MKKVHQQLHLDSIYDLGYDGQVLDVKEVVEVLKEVETFAKVTDLILKVKLKITDDGACFLFRYFKEESDAEYQARLEQEKEQERYEREIKEVQEKALLKELILKYGSPN
jgi:hypothetical protein